MTHHLLKLWVFRWIGRPSHARYSHFKSVPIMNTPKTPKNPIRWKPPKPRRSQHKGGIWGIRDPKMAAIFGWMMSYWPHVEEQIIFIFEELISGKNVVFTDTARKDAQNDTAISRASREIFLNITNNQSRIKIMRSLLLAPHNAERQELYDEIIDEFYSLNDQRNQYIHGRWMWTDQDKTLSFWAPSAEQFLHLEPRHVTEKELSLVFNRMRALFEKIGRRHGLPSSP